jgi:hypothetical protein
LAVSRHQAFPLTRLPAPESRKLDRGYVISGKAAERQIDMADKKMLKIGANGKIEVVAYTGYESLRDGVGGYIECISLSDTVSLWCNENGKLDGLPPNMFATMLFAEVFGNADIIVGDCCVLGGVDEEGESLECPQDVIDKVKRWADKLQPMWVVSGAGGRE